MKLSIIIPVYKVEKYIRECLSSIFCQNLDENVEVIVVNDGTTDNSMAIVDEFAQCNNNLVLINQTNQGLSVARNVGLDYATGEYVWFVDSDDSIVEGSLQYLLNYISKYTADVIGFDMIAMWESDKRVQLLPIVTSSHYSNLYGNNLVRRNIIHKIHTAAVQRYLFRRSFIEMHKLRFLPNIIHEDVDFMGRTLFFAQNIRLERKTIYRYLQRTTGSIMATLDMRSMECRHLILLNLEAFSKENVSNINDQIFLDDYKFKTLLLMLEFKSIQNRRETLYFIKKNSVFYQRIAWKGVLANLILLNVKKVLRGLLIVMNPSIYYKFSLNCKKSTI